MTTDRETVLAWCRERYGAKAPTDTPTAVQWCIGIAAQNGYLREAMG